MVTNIVNTYACKKPIANSKQVTRATISHGKNQKRWLLVAFHVGINANKNPNNIFSNVWPDIRFANNRIAKLNTLEKKEINSMITKKGSICEGTPLGTNKLKKLYFCILMPIRFIPIKEVNDKKKVTISELVIVYVYGIIPTRLQDKIKKKRLQI
jgi:hypothetical protein